MSIQILLLIIWLHWVADFICQSDYHAVNKSKKISALSEHIIIYMMPFMFMTLFTPLTILYVLVNGMLHWITDFFSSRATSYLWLKEKRHWFFVVIGLDQAIHMSCLILTYGLLVK